MGAQTGSWRRSAPAAGTPPRVGAYEIGELLGCGGMGAVWAARHRLLERDAAIKVMRATPRDDDGARARFEAEARVTAALTSPHTVRVFDFGRTADGEPFYAMERLRGCDFELLVRRFGALPVGRALHLLMDVCDGLAEAHERGLVHGDIKPANLYTCHLGLAYDVGKVLDFGLTQREHSNALSTPRGADRLMWGTPAYMAPEIVSGSAIDRRTDVYALGCVAHFLLTGTLVFEGDTAAEMVWRHLHVEPEPSSTKIAHVIPRELDRMILDCLHKDPTRRPRDAAELKRRLATVAVSDWTQPDAKRWWELHTSECAGPVTIGDMWIPSDGRGACDESADLTGGSAPHGVLWGPRGDTALQGRASAA